MTRKPQPGKKAGSLLSKLLEMVVTMDDNEIGSLLEVSHVRLTFLRIMTQSRIPQELAALALYLNKVAGSVVAWKYLSTNGIDNASVFDLLRDANGPDQADTPEKKRCLAVSYHGNKHDK